MFLTKIKRKFSKISLKLTSRKSKWADFFNFQSTITCYLRNHIFLTEIVITQLTLGNNWFLDIITKRVEHVIVGSKLNKSDHHDLRGVKM